MNFVIIMDENEPYNYFIIIFEVRENVISRQCTQVAQTSAKLTLRQSIPEETKSMEATTPELGPVGFWSPKSSSFRGSDSIVVEEAARNF